MKHHKIRAKQGWDVAFYEDYRKDPYCWTVTIIEDNVYESNLQYWEEFYIREYDAVYNGYNSTAKCSRKVGEHHYSKERNKKISESMKGKNNPNYGKHRKYKDPNNKSLGWIMV